MESRSNQADHSRGPHLCGEHGDVVELSTSSLFDRDSQEESAAVFGEHRLLVLHRARVDEPHTSYV